MSEKNGAMTAERIVEIKAREGKATPGPWGVFQECRGKKRVGIATKRSIEDVGAEELDVIVDCDGSGIRWEADAAFIAAARQDIPDLLAEVERLQRVTRYLAKKLVHDDGSGNSGFPGGKWKGAPHGDYGSLYRTREEAVQSWIDEAEREVGNERN